MKKYFKYNINIFLFCIILIIILVSIYYFYINNINNANQTNNLKHNPSIKYEKHIDILNKKVLRGPNIYTNKKVIVLEFNKDNSQLIISNFKNELFKIHNLSDKNIFNKIINKKFIFEFDHNFDSVLLKSCNLVLEIINRKINNQQKDFTLDYLKLQTEYNNIKIEIGTENILNICIKKNIPFIQLDAPNFFQLGWGINQKKIKRSILTTTSGIISKDKDLTKTILKEYGIPVPKGYLVQNEKDLLKYFKILKGSNTSVVLKPYDGSHGDGVFVNINNINSLLKIYKTIHKMSDYIIIEKFIKGFDYRILVIGHKVIAVAKRVPPFVIGDGNKNIIQLIDLLNSDPRRGDGHESPLTKIIIDEIVENTLKENGLNKNSIISKNKKVWLRKNANLSSGGTSEDVTDIVHKSIIDYSEKISEIIGLNTCGIDLICEDITKDLDSQNGAFLEVNSRPGLKMHISPNIGKKRNVGLNIINNLFPNNKNGRIPIISITGVNGKTTTTNLIAFIMNKKYLVGKITTHGIYINQKLIENCDCAGSKSVRKVLMNRNVEACVFETACEGILKKGLGYDAANVGILTNIGEGDYIGPGFDNLTIEELIDVKCVVIKNILPNGFVVLNANDKYIHKIISVIKNHSKIILFSIKKDNQLLQSHYLNGNSIIYYDGSNIVYSTGIRKEKSDDDCKNDNCTHDNCWISRNLTLEQRVSFKNKKQEELFKISDIPLLEEKISFQIENVMAALGGCIAINLDFDLIRKGLTEFISDTENNPGRFN